MGETAWTVLDSGEAARTPGLSDLSAYVTARFSLLLVFRGRMCLMGYKRIVDYRVEDAAIGDRWVCSR